MEDSLNSTQSAPSTGNPQDAVPADGASNATDFQNTAPYEALNQQTDELKVNQTGEPLSGASVSEVTPVSFYTWGIMTVVLLIVGLVILVKLIKETVEDDKESSSAPESTGKPATKQAKAKQKSSSKKKTTKTTAKRKKSGKKKR